MTAFGFVVLAARTSNREANAGSKRRNDRRVEWTLAKCRTVAHGAATPPVSQQFARFAPKDFSLNVFSRSYSRSFSAFLLGAALFSAPLLPRVFAQPTTSQTAPSVSRLPQLTLSTTVLPGGVGALSLSFPSNVSLPDKVRVALYENGGFARVADVKRRFVRVGGGLETQIEVKNASPGRYEVRVLSDTRERVLLAAPAELLVPGVEREPGWWLFNGSPVIASADFSQRFTPGLPMFLSGLRRDLGKKPKAPTRDFVLNAAPTWKLLDFPPEVLDAQGTSSSRNFSQMTRLDYDFAKLQSDLTRAIADAQKRGEGGFLGFSVDLRLMSREVTPEAARTALRRLQSVRDAVAPNAALVLVTDDVSPFVKILDAVAPLCDAVEVRAGTYYLGTGNPKSALDELNLAWGMKVARRDAEEQANYDLPIFHAPTSNDPKVTVAAFFSGATGLIGESGDFEPVLKRNLSLFVNSVTLEDVGVLPLGNDEAASQIAGRLRLAGRVPQLSRAVTNDYKTPEAFYARLDENTTSAQLDSLLRTARAGGRVYLEGSLAPNSPLASQLRELGGGTLTARESRDVSLKLDDPWIFGTLHNSTLSVTQRASVKLAPSTIGKQASKPEEGLDKLIEPRVVATLDDGTPGIILNPVGKGQVMWLPHAWKNAPTRTFDTAVSGYLGPALARLRSVDAKNNEVTGDVAALRVSVRRSPKGTLLVALTNASAAAVATQIAVDGAPEFCLDLNSERELPVSRRGFEGRANVTVPANGYALLAFNSDRKTFNAERATPRLKAKLR